MSDVKNKEYIDNIQKQFNDMYELDFGIAKVGQNSIEEIYKLIEVAKTSYCILLAEYRLNPSAQKFQELTHAVWASAGLTYYIEYLEKRKKTIEQS